MRIAVLVGVVSVALASAHSAAADPPSPAGAKAAAAPAALPDNAVRLSRLINPGDKILKLGMQAFQTGLDTELKRKPDEAAIYQKNPGLLDAISAAARPVMQSYLVAVIPDRQQRFARFYADNLSPADIDQLIAFYSSPTGAKVIDTMYAGMNLDKLVDAAAAHPGGALTGQDVAEFNSSAAATLPDKFDADDWKTLFIFSASPARAKLVHLTPAFNKLVADVENEPDPALDAALDKAITGAVNAYLSGERSRRTRQRAGQLDARLSDP